MRNLFIMTTTNRVRSKAENDLDFGARSRKLKLESYITAPAPFSDVVAGLEEGKIFIASNAARTSFQIKQNLF